MESTAELLASLGVATLRFQFPYVEAGGRRPDPPALLEATVRAAVARAAEEELPLFAGGKSMGGRMTSQTHSKEALPLVRGLVFLGFPLHPPGRNTVARATHLARVTIPMLFVQGTRDDLADLELMRGTCAGLGARATLHVVDGGDHSFRVLKRTGRTGDDVMQEIGNTVGGFLRAVLEKERP
jgi:predicted alpha/beta-hydrolase family hydrolase